MSSFTEDDDRPVGRPIQAPRTATAVPPPPSVPAAPVEGVREEETAWRPVQTPVLAATLSDEELLQVSKELAREEAAEAKRLEEMLTAEPTLLRLPAILSHPLAGAFLLASAALLGLFVFAQITNTLAALQTLPQPWQYAGWVGLGLLSLVLLYAIGRFIWAFVRYGTSRPLRLKGLEEVARRTQMRHLVQKKRGEAREQLMKWLRDYDLDNPVEVQALATQGLDEAAVKMLVSARTGLMDLNRFTTTEEWFAAVRSRFQVILDETADERIKSYARRVAVLSAASPNTLVDVMIALTCAFALLADLCHIYHLRMSRLGTAVLLGRIFFNAYLAGQLNEWESLTEKGIESLVTEAGLHLGSLAADAFAARAAGKIGSRAASGVLNYLLLRRLGTYAAGLLRPIHAD